MAYYPNYRQVQRPEDIEDEDEQGKDWISSVRFNDSRASRDLNFDTYDHCDVKIVENLENRISLSSERVMIRI